MGDRRYPYWHVASSMTVSHICCLSPKNLSGALHTQLHALGLTHTPQLFILSLAPLWERTWDA